MFVVIKCKHNAFIQNDFLQCVILHLYASWLHKRNSNFSRFPFKRENKRKNRLILFSKNHLCVKVVCVAFYIKHNVRKRKAYFLLEIRALHTGINQDKRCGKWLPSILFSGHLLTSHMFLGKEKKHTLRGTTTYPSRLYKWLSKHFNADLQTCQAGSGHRCERSTMRSDRRSEYPW